MQTWDIDVLCLHNHGKNQEAFIGKGVGEHQTLLPPECVEKTQGISVEAACLA
jgi:hypothetical protein